MDQDQELRCYSWTYPSSRLRTKNMFRFSFLTRIKAMTMKSFRS